MPPLWKGKILKKYRNEKVVAKSGGTFEKWWNFPVVFYKSGGKKCHHYRNTRGFRGFSPN